MDRTKMKDILEGSTIHIALDDIGPGDGICLLTGSDGKDYILRATELDWWLEEGWPQK